MAYETSLIDTIKQWHTHSGLSWSAMPLIVVGERALIDIGIVLIGCLERQEHILSTMFSFQHTITGSSVTRKLMLR